MGWRKVIEKNISKNTAIKRIGFIIAFTIVLSAIIVYLQYGKFPRIYFVVLIIGIVLMSLFGTIGIICRNNNLIKELRNNHGKLQFILGIILVLISLPLFMIEESVRLNDFYSLILGIVLIISGLYQIKKRKVSK